MSADGGDCICRDVSRVDGDKKRLLDDDAEEGEDDEECGTEYSADGADDDLGDGEVTDGGEVEVRDDEEDDDSADCVDEEFESVPEEEEEDRRDCDGDDDHKYCFDHAWYTGWGKEEIKCCGGPGSCTFVPRHSIDSIVRRS